MGQGSGCVLGLGRDCKYVLVLGQGSGCVLGLGQDCKYVLVLGQGSGCVLGLGPGSIKPIARRRNFRMAQLDQ